MKQILILSLIMVVLCAAAFLVPMHRAITEQATMIQDQAKHIDLQNQIIQAQSDLIQAHEQQHIATSAFMEQLADTLHAITYAPYSREQVDAKLAEVIAIIEEMNSTLTPDEVTEIAESLVLCSIVTNTDKLLPILTVESRARNITGKAGEIGIMQVMPSTGAWIARDMGYTNYDPEQLWDYRRNIRDGAYYLQAVTRDMGDEWGGVLAYNKGASGARTFLASNDISRSGYIQRVRDVE